MSVNFTEDVRQTWDGMSCMGEVDPARQQEYLVELRKSKLSPQAARKVLLSAGLRIMGEADFSAQQRRQASVYLETILRVADKLEGQGADTAKGSRHTRGRLDMGNLMGLAFLEIHQATFLDRFDPSDPGHQEVITRMQRTVCTIESHVASACWQYGILGSPGSRSTPE